MGTLTIQSLHSDGSVLEERRFTMPDRATARAALLLELAMTASVAWATEVLERFDRGEDEISMPNGREVTEVFRWVDQRGPFTL